MPEPVQKLEDHLQTDDGHRTINRVISLLETSIRMQGYVPQFEAEVVVVQLRELLEKTGGDS